MWTPRRHPARTLAALVAGFALLAAACGDDETEPLDCDPFNQASVREALDDLVISAKYWEGQGEKCDQIILEWGDDEAEDHLRPRKWDVNAILGTSYSQEEDGLFIWTDIWPDAAPGNVDGDSGINAQDRADPIEGGPGRAAPEAVGTVEAGSTGHRRVRRCHRPPKGVGLCHPVAGGGADVYHPGGWGDHWRLVDPVHGPLAGPRVYLP